MDERYDIAIIGSGPAGLSAALNAKIRKKKFVIFGNDELSGKLVKAQKINNYLGFYGMSGAEIKEQFDSHIKSMDIKITNERINNIYSMGDYFALMANDKTYEALTVILATGVNFGKPFEGEERLLGKGVGYCATCDAPLYKNKVVTIIAYNKKEESEANFVASIASKVYYIPMYNENIELDPKIEVIKGIPIKIEGQNKVEKLILKDREIETEGLFILRESVSPGQLVPGLKVTENHVEVDRFMKTNLNGCFAAGDIVGMPYQYIKAAGEGNIAALSAVSYLDKFNRK
ncbi:MULTISPECIES: NAD(P)/FAD-dependent oxidoreductase [Clostridium]|uniref:Thioredoxin-disulfide reductase n=2 Tax=Clostridium butyricum TaxID=1492 RepID=C4IL27_CLOBU|nr:MULTISPECIES: NAD(P)/FAD-dependent oxidoreductase [Clostridium]APF22681.1 pyridine nucleotide-disulfide oxidoreductase family protein [Clostridium butyricum]EDT75717.1 tRNA uridine 5-carboxymethylaminomethyl modification enzyme GidA [Clostridium butyricum 5521]EEP54544.1 thioredoxin-disulfide reductase [Clostridium butyricum E4 str. BoNT E BL5262]EMU55169.1 thioredoxin-disulfide reductase [Clostridium butyricum DKU-01]MBZ5747302.1 NAD(P)/FAD-dependent oxidoreductase [Clostridium butyricum]